MLYGVMLQDGDTTMLQTPRSLNRRVEVGEPFCRVRGSTWYVAEVREPDNSGYDGWIVCTADRLEPAQTLATRERVGVDRHPPDEGAASGL
jgi:hypothetical protein